jgi:large subunit ribosomal protein L9
MKVILTGNVKNVGKVDDLVNVSEGYARNFLFPRKLAVEANAANMAEFNKRKKTEELKGEKALQDAKETGAKISETKVTIVGKVGSGSRLYGSITSGDIADALAKQAGIKIDKCEIELDEPIKALGQFDVPIRLHRQITTRLKVEIVAG